jgi:hypothetical protein
MISNLAVEVNDMKKWKAGFFAGLFLGGGLAGASTVIALDLKALSQQAEVIVLGRCLESSVRWNADRTRIYTDWTVAVDQAVKGAPGQQVVVRQLGGELDGKGLLVSGVVRLSAGEEAVLFLGPAREGVRRILGLSQGHFRVQTDPVTGRKWVWQPAVSAPATAASSPTGASAVQVSLDEFLAQVRKAAAEAKP